MSRDKFMTALLFLIVLCASYSILVFESQKATSQSNVTVTPIPTSKNPIQLENLQRLLSDDTCVHPCWLAWTLGKSDLTDAQTLMRDFFGRTLYVIEDLPEEQGYWRVGASFGTTYPYLDSEGVLIEFSDTLFNLFVRQDNNVVVSSGLRISQPRWSYIDWSAYSLPHILLKYGVPDEVTITYPMDGAHGAISPSYDLTLRYFSLGIFVSYFTVIDEADIIIGDSEHGLPICNSLSKVAILLAWQQSEAMPDLEMTEQWDRVRFTQDYERSLDTVSDLTLEAFTELFSQPDTCFTTLRPNQWKPPFVW